METIKTAFVVVLLMAVLYGVYVVLTKPEPTLSPEMDWLTKEAHLPDIQVSGGESVGVVPAAIPAVSSDVPASPLPLLDTAVTARATDSVPEIQAPPAGINDMATAANAHLDDSSVASASAEAVPKPLPSIPESPPSSYRSVYEAAPSSAMANGERVASAVEELTPNDPSSAFQLPAAPETPVAESTPSGQSTTFDSAWDSALAQLEKEQWSEALLTLSLFYNDASLSLEQRTKLLDLLDPLAGKVIYSTEHTMEPPHTVQAGETLEDVARQMNVPPSLLQNINGISSASALTPGTQLKVVRGPFRAEVDLSQSELTLFLGKYYAGRFPISVGNDPAPKPGDFTVQDKQPGREYFAADRSRIAPLAADNPYGHHWISLGGDICIHGSPTSIPSHGGLGCISLTTADAADIYGILSVGSKVTLR